MANGDFNHIHRLFMRHLSFASLFIFATWLGALNGQTATLPVLAKPASQAANPPSGLGLDCPCHTIEVKGDVYLGDHKTKKGEKITSKQNVRFSTSGDVVAISDNTGRNYFLKPFDFSVDRILPCHQKGVDCTPVLNESLVPVTYQNTGMYYTSSIDSLSQKEKSPQSKIKVIKPFSPDKN